MAKRKIDVKKRNEIGGVADQIRSLTRRAGGL